jgi:hypothetical protein
MFNNLNHKGNANQDSIEIPSYFSQNDCLQENKQEQMLVRILRKRNPYTLLVGM